MAATCSESGLKAMSDAMQLPGKSTIHTVDGHWLMQVYPVEVTHARQRSLTLLEHHLLKAFNGIPGCSARDIIGQFGLDPLLVESTLRTLKLCNTIDSVGELDSINKTDDNRRTLNTELKEILDRLAVVGGNIEQLNELQRQRDVLQQKIQQHEKTAEPKDGDRFARMKFQVNALGKEALMNKYMKEPTEMKIYSFARCMTTGVIHIVGGKDIENGAIEGSWPEKDTAVWQNKTEEKWSLVEPTRREIEEVLSSVHTNEAIEINTIQVLESKFANREVHLPLHFTLTVGHEDRKQEWLVHLQREHVPRVQWLEAHLQELNSQHPSLLKHLAKSLPKPKGMGATSVKNASPLVRFDRLVAQERAQRGILVVHEHEQLTNLIDMQLQSLDQLLGSRTIVCLSNRLKKKYEVQQPGGLAPPNFVIPSNNIMKQGTIAMSSGFFEAGIVSIPFDSKEELHLPVLCHSEARGRKTVAKVDEYLRKLLRSEHLFLLTNAPADLDQWIQEMIASIKSKNMKAILDDFRKIQTELSEVVEPLGLAYMRSAVESFVDRFSTDCLNSNEGIQSLLEIVHDAPISPNEKTDCWAIIERSIHSLAVETSSSEQNSDLFGLWKAVRQRKQAIPWEEMAHLEDTLLGNCTMTRFEVNRHMERIVKDLIVGNQRPVSDLASMMSDLRQINVIDKKLHSELKKTKAGRNMLTHEHDMDADLTHTLEAVKTMRLLATLTEPIDDPRWSTKEEYQNFSWNFSIEGINQYLNHCLDLVGTFGKERKFTQSLWFDGLRTRLPVTYSEIPFEMAKTLEEITALQYGLNGESIKQNLLKEASTSWGNSLETPSHYSISKNVLDSLNRLTERGLGEEATKMAELILEEVPKPHSVEALLDEVNNAEDTMKIIAPMHAIVRWKRTIEQPKFTVQLEALSKSEEDCLSRMGKDVREKLLKKALEPYFGNAYTVKTIENGIAETDAFVKSNKVWAPVLKALENWMSERCIRQLKQGSETEMVLWLEHMTTKELEKTSLTLLKEKLKSALDNLKRKIKKSEDAKAKQKPKKKGRGKK